MPRYEVANTYSPKAYYFGILSLILLFTERGIAWTLSVPGNRLPTSLAWITLFLAVISTTLSVKYAFKGRKEPASVKKGIGWLLTMGVVVFTIYILYQKLTAKY